jgi:hypothetical protein
VTRARIAKLWILHELPTSRTTTEAEVGANEELEFVAIV